jgi:hypothetical protein
MHPAAPLLFHHHRHHHHHHHGHSHTHAWPRPLPSCSVCARTSTPSCPPSCHFGLVCLSVCLLPGRRGPKLQRRAECSSSASPPIPSAACPLRPATCVAPDRILTLLHRLPYRVAPPSPQLRVVPRYPHLPPNFFVPPFPRALPRCTCLAALASAPRDNRVICA